jgi:NAD(P)-dependent dehydrogenase (short-subunit alcohol dehydrogenase family)
VLTADLIYGVQTPRILDHRRMPTHVAPIPRATDLTFTQLEDRSGDAFTASPKDAAALFPHLSAFMSATAVAELTACSYIAGMECPGLHSMLSKLDLVFGKVNPAHADRVAVHYQVTDCDERFHRARIAVTGAAICGTLDVFMRTPPVKQPSMQALTARVDASEFLGMNALIIGGSRGLGELSAKLIAAGGGTPTITYVLGRTEAEQVAAHIGEWGGKADVMPYDVCLPPESQLAATAINFTHLFYFATNPIFKPKGALVSTASLAAFTTFYLHGFYNLCVQLIKSRGASGAGSQDLIAFYPSSTAIDERPLGMTEYAMVKAAGEQMCRDMNQHLPGLHIVTKRLPRIRTDQTATVIPERDVDPVTVLLPVLRGMKRLLMT